jgi:hypothetical protein
MQYHSKYQALVQGCWLINSVYLVIEFFFLLPKDADQVAFTA